MGKFEIKANTIIIHKYCHSLAKEWTNCLINLLSYCLILIIIYCNIILIKSNGVLKILIYGRFIPQAGEVNWIQSILTVQFSDEMQLILKYWWHQIWIECHLQETIGPLIYWNNLCGNFFLSKENKLLKLVVISHTFTSKVLPPIWQFLHFIRNFPLHLSSVLAFTLENSYAAFRF